MRAGYLRTLVVTFPAENGDVHHGGGRAWVRARKDVVLLVTVRAGRGVGITPGGRLAVQRGAVLPALRGMAAPAVHRSAVLRVRESESLVAVRAPQPRVRRAVEEFLCHHETTAVLPRLPELCILVAHEAGGVLLPNGRSRGSAYREQADLHHPPDSTDRLQLTIRRCPGFGPGHVAC